MSAAASIFQLLGLLGQGASLAGQAETQRRQRDLALPGRRAGTQDFRGYDYNQFAPGIMGSLTPAQRQVFGDQVITGLGTSPEFATQLFDLERQQGFQNDVLVPERQRQFGEAQDTNVRTRGRAAGLDDLTQRTVQGADRAAASGQQRADRVNALTAEAQQRARRLADNGVFTEQELDAAIARNIGSEMQFSQNQQRNIESDLARRGVRGGAASGAFANLGNEQRLRQQNAVADLVLANAQSRLPAEQLFQSSIGLEGLGADIGRTDAAAELGYLGLAAQIPGLADALDRQALYDSTTFGDRLAMSQTPISLAGLGDTIARQDLINQEGINWGDQSLAAALAGIGGGLFEQGTSMRNADQIAAAQNQGGGLFGLGGSAGPLTGAGVAGADFLLTAAMGAPFNPAALLGTYAIGSGLGGSF